MHDKFNPALSQRTLTLIQGFTLIELLVSITIILILTGGAIAGFIGFKDRQDAFNAAKELQLFYQTAQRKALVREVPQIYSCTNQATNQLFRGYQVDYSSPGTFTRKALCGTSNSSATAQNPPTNYIVNSSIFVTYTSSTDPVKFYSLYEGTNIPATDIVTITLSKGGKSYAFTINTKGTVSDITTVTP